MDPSRKPLITLIDEVTTIATLNRKRKYSFSFLARIQPVKRHGLFVEQPSQLPFPCYKSALHLSPFGDLHMGSLWLQSLNYNSLLIPNKLIFAGEISGSLFVSGQEREGSLHDQGTHGRLRKANYPLDTSEKT